MLFAIASFRHGIFDILPVARDLVFDGISEGVIVLDERNRISDFNRAAATYIEGLSAASVGERLEDVSTSRTIADVMAIELNAAPPAANGVEVGITHDGIEKVFEVKVTPMIDRSGTLQCKALLMRDVTERKLMLEQLERQAHTDPLTGLRNRRQLEAEAGRLIPLARRMATPLSLAVVDLDEFKTINDTRGHHAGDGALRRVATLLVERLRSTDIVCRVGGDEFVALLPGTAAEAATTLMDELRETFQEEGDLTLSIGIAELSTDHSNLTALLGVADERLYEAKRRGRNRVVGCSLK